MLQLAIRGHATRGREVIQLLEMLGADRLGYKDTFVGFYYYIECDVIVSSDECPIDAIVFTLEEFEKKYPYKVGDKVIYEDKIREITKMVWEEQTNTIAYKFDDKLYCNVIDDLQPYKEETNMAQLAIKGHKTRGKKVIQLLEMLGGKNIHNYVGTSNECYVIDDNTICTINPSVAKLDNCVIFTLEELLEEFPYKVGDDVITKSNNVYKITKMMWNNKEIVYALRNGNSNICWYNTAELQPYKEELTMKKKSKLINIQPKLVGNECVHFPIPPNMKLEVKDGMCYLYRDCGEQCKREGVNLQKMERKLDEALAKETPESLNKWLDEENMEKRLEPVYELGTGKILYYVEKVSGEKYCPIGETTLYIQDGYEFRDETNNVINAKRITLVRKQPQYPKSYKECCSVLGIEDDLQFVYENIDGRHINPACISHYRMRKLNLYDNFEDLITCRDAYWKIAGEQMGLDKPWEPDWSNDDETKFCIYTTQNMISLDIFGVDNRILAFPTEEMRDMFHVNFKGLIEQCKELL